MKFKVGDLVKIKDGLKEDVEYGGLTLYSGTMNFTGAKRIERISGSRSQFYGIGWFSYTKEMLEKVEEKENGMRFKVGDKVRVREWEDMERQFGVDSDGDIVCEKIFISPMRGHCGKTFEISSVMKDYYKLKGDGGNWNYSDGMLVPAEFTKSDMKEGMLVEMRDGEKMLWINGLPRGIQNYSSAYNEDLTATINEDADIIRVGYPKKGANTISEMLDFGFSEIIWERQKQPTTKDVSLDEINALLREKYPSIEHFNLPIKE